MLKKLKSLFIIEEDDASQSQATTGAGGQTGPSDKSATPVTTDLNSTSDSSDGGKVSDRFLKVLLTAMEENDLDGFDYLEYKDFLRSLDKVNMEEETQYKSAFATAQTMGATVGKIKESAQHYIDVLKGERAKFEEAVEKRRTQVLESQRLSIEKLEQSVTDKLARIEELKKEVEATREKIKKKKAEFATSQDKVEKTNADFIHTYNVLVDQIQEDLNKINTYLS
ncbi:MAG: hypothetical protein R3301_12665 [Saprospiraceae bacterium]|nr:hypothetical protein [Saprospiraceae bacterium]